MNIGITGVVGTGKTTISTVFAKHGFNVIKQPYSFSSQRARDIADNPDYDDIQKAVFFLEDRIRIIRDVDPKRKYLFDRWWLDVCLNVNEDLFPTFCEIYTSSFFSSNFIGVFLEIDLELAIQREENYSPEIVRDHAARYKKMIKLIEGDERFNHFTVLKVDVTSLDPTESYYEIIKTVNLHLKS